jgi:hypothetical protein
MKKKLIILAIVILILISGVVAYVVISENTNNSVKTLNNTTKNVTNTTISQNNTTNEETQLSKTLKIKDDPNFATTKKIGKDDMIYVFYNSGFNGQVGIHRGLIIHIVNDSNIHEGYPQFKISYVVVKLKDNNNNTVYKTYTPNYGEDIKVKIPKDLTPISATVYYKPR